MYDERDKDKWRFEEEEVRRCERLSSLQALVEFDTFHVIYEGNMEGLSESELYIIAKLNGELNIYFLDQQRRGTGSEGTGGFYREFR